MSIGILSRITVYQTLIDIQPEIEKLGTITEQKGRQETRKNYFHLDTTGLEYSSKKGEGGRKDGNIKKKIWKKIKQEIHGKRHSAKGGRKNIVQKESRSIYVTREKKRAAG